jgi:hypothetical protein
LFSGVGRQLFRVMAGGVGADFAAVVGFPGRYAGARAVRYRRDAWVRISRRRRACGGGRCGSGGRARVTAGCAGNALRRTGGRAEVSRGPARGSGGRWAEAGAVYSSLLIVVEI